METNNKNLTDEQLDDLICQSFSRQQMVDEINVSVMKQLRHDSRHRNLLRWGKIAAFAFGLPLALFLFGWLLWWSSVGLQTDLQFSFFDGQWPVFLCLVLPVCAMLYAAWQAIKNFSPSDV